MSCGHDHGGMEKKTTQTNFVKVFTIFVFVLGGVYYLLMQHKAHMLQYLPIVIFLISPLMHIFGGHGGHGGHSREGSEKEGQK